MDERKWNGDFASQGHRYEYCPAAVTQTQTAWVSLYNANTRVNGAQTATVGTNAGKRAIISKLTQDEILAAGGTAENGGWNLQMLATDLGALPAKFDVVQVFADTIPLDNAALKVSNVDNNNGVFYITATDFVAHES